MAELKVQKAGMSIVTDLGRRAAHLGQSLNGALDQYAAKVANTLVGNEHNAPLIEMTLADLSLVSDRDMLVAVTGAAAEVSTDGVLRPQWEPLLLLAGEILRVQHGPTGLRSYLAVSGTLEVPTLLGSCAPDTLIGFGLSLTGGLHIPVKNAPAVLGLLQHDWPVLRPAASKPDAFSHSAISVTPGPDYYDFEDTIERLSHETYTVGARSNHIGLRLQGRVPLRQSTGELLSTGVPLGAIEVPSQDELLVLHRGRGVTAGYPVPAVVTASGLDALAQVRPGDRVRFKMVETREAVELARESHRELHHLRLRMEAIFIGHGVSPRWNLATATRTA